MPLKLDWRGDEIVARMRAASQDGVDETMGLCVNGAKPEVPVLSATYQGSIRFEPARSSGNRRLGRVGQL